jgi:hypothetical protein
VVVGKSGGSEDVRLGDGQEGDAELIDAFHHAFDRGSRKRQSVDSSFVRKLPDGGEADKEFIAGVGDGFLNAGGEMLWLLERPEQGVGVEQQPQISPEVMSGASFIWRSSSLSI